VSPLARVEATLHPWTSYVVVPLFALANAGVALGVGALRIPAGGRVAAAIMVARVVGKPLGIAIASAFAIRVGLARLPGGTTRAQLLGVAVAAGIPFTVSIYVAELSLPPELVDAAKLGILAAAALAGGVGLVILRRWGARDDW
jgi:NhaA family Na+:H+ antiporter